MVTLVSIPAVALVIAGIVTAIRGRFVVAWRSPELVGPGGVSIFT